MGYSVRLSLFRAMSTLKSTEKEITIRAPWGNIKGLTWGDSKNPPVLLSPGRLVPCSGFRPLILKLPTNFFYVSIDLPGNGYSDHLPKGVRFTIWDLVPTLQYVTEHFKWEHFIYIAHSLGTAVGKYFNMAYPGVMTKVVDLDPVPAYHTILPEEIPSWYKEIYGSHYQDKSYKKHTSGKESAPKYSYQQIKEMIMKAQQLSEEAANQVLDRYIEPAGDGLFRFSYDQRMKSTFKLPFQPQHLKEMYTPLKTPTLAIIAKGSIDNGSYSRVPFVMDEYAWPHGNYRYKIVNGGHDVHLENPDCMADDISKFLLEDIKAKL
ncbi:serine hydrolase-like protein [Vanessa tameamea]|uniref:Serine hydrolase-like protein n=1 Tax=Vanessa tameamea TaxID=334116 RepID=A0A8B8I3K8_VANTA